MLVFAHRGAVAQLGERLNGIQEVVGSIPINSTRNTREGNGIRCPSFLSGERFFPGDGENVPGKKGVTSIVLCVGMNN